MRVSFYLWKMPGRRSRNGGSTTTARDLMGPWVMRRRWNLLESMWQNSKKNHLMIDPKTGYTSFPVLLTLKLMPFLGGAVHLSDNL